MRDVSDTILEKIKTRMSYSIPIFFR